MKLIQVDLLKGDKKLLKIASCVYCKHRTTKRGEAAKCSAFPEGIPRNILGGNEYHLDNIEGDNGICYEPLSEDKDFRKIFNIKG